MKMMTTELLKIVLNATNELIEPNGLVRISSDIIHDNYLHKEYINLISNGKFNHVIVISYIYKRDISCIISRCRFHPIQR